MKALKWKNFKIGFKYGIALLIIIILFIAASAYSMISLTSIKDSIETIETKGERAVTITHMSYLFKAKNSLISDYIFFPAKSLLEEYDSYDKEFIELQEKMEPEMNTEDLQFLFNNVVRNNKEINDIFKKSIIPELKKNNKQEVMQIETKVSSINKSSFEILDKLREMVNKEREASILEANNAVLNTINTLILAILVAIVSGIGIIMLISRGISKHLKQIVDMVNKVSKGELTVKEINYDGKDEIGELSLAMNKMQRNLRSMIKEITESSLEVNNQGNTLNNIAKEVKEGSEQIGTTMEEMASGAQEQASSSSEITNLISGLTELIEQANQSGIALEESSKGILDTACQGNEQMEISIEKMNEINYIFKASVTKVRQLEKNSENISKLVQVINAISEQTNLLALNAAIEAARAGEAGRGFAVVAEEIRKLAEQVGDSVSEITNIVVSIQNESRLMVESLDKGYREVEEGTNQIKITGQSFKEINDEVKQMVNKIKHISENLSSITNSSKSVNTASEQIATISEENSAGIQQTVASVEQQNSSMEVISENANSLSDLAYRLNKIVSQFKL